MTEPRPSIGRTVHYVSYGTPGGEFGQQCRAAIVTEVEPATLGEPDTLTDRVGLAVLNPTGIFLHSLSAGGCPYQDSRTGLVGGTWHWPERV